MVLFQFSKDLIRTHPTCQQLLQHCSAPVFLASSVGLASALVFFVFSVTTSILASFRAIFFSFKLPLKCQYCGDGCDFCCECFLRGLLFRNLRCKISSHSFRLILATFCSRHNKTPRKI